MKGITVIWLVVLGACFFVIGFLTHKFIADESRSAPPSYLERLKEDLGLSEDQEEAIRELFAEEDRRIQALMDSEQGMAVRDRIDAIRRETQRGIDGVLTAEQKGMRARLPPASGPMGKGSEPGE
jgi:hypothetical protein